MIFCQKARDAPATLPGKPLIAGDKSILCRPVIRQPWSKIAIRIELKKEEGGAQQHTRHGSLQSVSIRFCSAPQNAPDPDILSTNQQ